ncbi:MAG: hypothetical protein L0H25_09125, partial [Micrococcales bacterium]|nr:hypothetical protein [Micrococcales bacterium]
MLHSTTPSVVSPGTSVTVTGTITAPAAAGLPAGEVRIVRGTARLGTRADVDAWAADTRRATGPVLGAVNTAAVGAGESATFAITLASGTVRSTRAFAAIPISIELTTAETDSQGERQAASQAVTHSFLAWQARKEYDPLTVAMLVPVTLDPDPELFARDRASRTRAWRRAIGEGSRIQAIVEETRGTPLTLAVDPAVLGPDVDDAAPDESPGPRSQPTDLPTSSSP